MTFCSIFWQSFLKDSMSVIFVVRALSPQDMPSKASLVCSFISTEQLDVFQQGQDTAVAIR